MPDADFRVTLGIAHNNYLNIKNNPKNPWMGLAELEQDSHGHAIFKSPEYGLRAAILNLRKYWFAYGLRSVLAIVNRWAPPDDTIGSRQGNPKNNPSEYADFICKRTGLTRTENLSLFQPNQSVDNVGNLRLLVKAMAEFECGHGFIMPDAAFVGAVQLLQPDFRPPATWPGPAAPDSKQAAAVPVPAPVAAAPATNVLETQISEELRERLSKISGLDLLELLKNVLPPAAAEDKAAQGQAPAPTGLASPSASDQAASGETEKIEVRTALPVGGFSVDGEVLRRLMVINAFPLPDEVKLVFFGFRGCLPVDPSDVSFAARRTLKVAPLNYQNPRCTIGQWNLEDDTVAVFPGSTIPTHKYVVASKAKGGRDVNQLMPGYYSFVKGIHHANSARAHPAFKQEGNRIYRRATDNEVYDPSDSPDIGNPGDNLHAAYGDTLDGSYSSAGCQVVLGVPQCEDYPVAKEPWPTFHDHAYQDDEAQQEFHYILLEAAEVVTVAEDPKASQRVLLRCGSEDRALTVQPGLIAQVQKALKTKGSYQGPADGIFGAGSALALVKFQKATFGMTLADGVIGLQTAAALGFQNWPIV